MRPRDAPLLQQTDHRPWRLAVAPPADISTELSLARVKRIVGKSASREKKEVGDSGKSSTFFPCAAANSLPLS